MNTNDLNPNSIEQQILVLVQAQVVVGIYPQHQAEAATEAAKRMERLNGWTVSIYELDSSHGETPVVGQQVEPERLQWRAKA
jgi:hypothetical protein